MVVANPSFPGSFYQVCACKLPAFFPKSLFNSFLRYNFTLGFQQVVDAYKRLLAPAGIKVEVETAIAIEVEEVHAPEIDYSSVKEFLKYRPPSRMSVGRKKVIGNKRPTLVLDFSSVRELIPPALPKVTTTYIDKENVTVVNEWNFMLLQLSGLSYGILFYVPGTELWTFVDVSVSGNHHQSTLPGNPIELPLDLIAWQIFDFFTHRVNDHAPKIKEGFAPFSLSCPDRILAKLLSNLFLDLGLPSERQIGISKQSQVPRKYWEHITTLTNKRAILVPVDSFRAMLTCAGCFRLFAHMYNSLSLCNICSEMCEGYQRDLDNQLPYCEYPRGGEIDGRRNSTGPNAVVCGIPRFAIGHLPQSLHFTRKRNTEPVEKRGQDGRLNGGTCRKQKKPQCFRAPPHPADDHSQPGRGC